MTINQEEWALIRNHHTTGAELLSQSGVQHLQMAVDVARHHHEEFDAAGFPHDLAAGVSPQAARMTSSQTS